MLDFLINIAPPVRPTAKMPKMVNACSCVSIMNPVTLDVTGTTTPIMVMARPIENITAFMLFGFIG